MNRAEEIPVAGSRSTTGPSGDPPGAVALSAEKDPLERRDGPAARALVRPPAERRDRQAPGTTRRLVGL